MVRVTKPTTKGKSKPMHQRLRAADRSHDSPGAAERFKENPIPKIEGSELLYNTREAGCYRVLDRRLHTSCVLAWVESLEPRAIDRRRCTVRHENILPPDQRPPVKVSLLPRTR